MRQTVFAISVFMQVIVSKHSFAFYKKTKTDILRTCILNTHFIHQIDRLTPEIEDTLNTRKKYLIPVAVCEVFGAKSTEFGHLIRSGQARTHGCTA